MKAWPKGHWGSATGHKGGKMPGATGTKKVIVEFPEDLLERTDMVASKLSTDRSKLIRSAVEQLLNSQSRAEMERELAEGYRTHADFDRRMAAEFAFVDGENI